MAEYRPPLGDILHIVKNVIGLDRLGDPALDDDTADSVLSAAASFISGELAPLGPTFDREGCRLENGRVALPKAFPHAWRRWSEDGWQALTIPPEHGGQGMPELMAVAVAEMVLGACVPFGMLTLLGRSGAQAVLAHAPTEIAQIVVPHLADGSWTATIVMTEPSVGSDAGRLTTRAEPLADGRFKISGEKIFISFGDHDAADAVMHIVIARIGGAPPGPKGVSLFLVPSHQIKPDGSLGPRNAVAVTRIEQKMGIHGSPTCAVSFDGAEGWLLGEPNHGLAAIFSMANTMRLETGLQGVAIGAAATDRAARYALERIQGLGSDGKPAVIADHPDVRRMLMTMKGMSDGARTLIYEAAIQLDLSRRLQDPEARRRAEGLSAFLLPVCKAVCTDLGVEVASLGIQIHGGHGYVWENGAEQLMRDARIAPIYEGTNGIQAIDLLTRKIGREPWRLQLFIETVRADVSAKGGNAPPALVKALRDGLNMLEDAAAVLLRAMAETPRDALAGATPFLALVGRIGLGWSWLRMATCETGDPQLLRTHRAMAQAFAQRIMVDMPALKAQATAGATDLDGLTKEMFAASV